MRDELNAAILWARSILAHKLRNIVIIVGATLIFYGAVHLGELLSLVLLVVGTRATFIAFELINRPPLLSELPAIGEQLLSHYKNLTPERRERAALEFGLDGNATPESFVVAALAQIKSEILNRRTSPELITDLFGLITYCAILPINLLLYTRDFVSPHSNQEWFGALLLLFGLILYVWPLKWQKTMSLTRRRMIWWGVPFIPALILLILGITLRHPYLNYFRKNHIQLAADKVLSLRDNIVAGRETDWVIAYANELNEQGKSEQAIRYFKRALILDPSRTYLRQRLAQLAQTFPTDKTGSNSPLSSDKAFTPYWPHGLPTVHLPRCDIDIKLASVERTTIIVIGTDEVNDWILDDIGDVISRELEIPVCVATRSIKRPEHTRRHGIVFGRQWSAPSLIAPFAGYANSIPSAPLRYVLVTSADIYEGDANFIFSASYDWGALASSAQLQRAGDSQALIIERTAKQSLGAIMKSFDVPISPDRKCVTSYSNGLEQFDQKGNRPNAESLAIFKSTETAINVQWSAQRQIQRD